MPQSAMIGITAGPWNFRLALTATVAILLAAWFAYRSGTGWLPGILLFISAITATGAFSFLEDRLIRLVDESSSRTQADLCLYAVRIGRTVTLLALGILMIVLFMKSPGT
jgi:hypothetical protein